MRHLLDSPYPGPRRPADVEVRILDSRTGATQTRESFFLVHAELVGGELINLTADSLEGKRLQLRLRAGAIEDLGAPPRAAGPDELAALRERAAVIHLDGAPGSRRADATDHAH